MKPRVMKAIKILAGLMVVVAVVWAAYRFVIRPWHLTWGATPAEISAGLPGDEYVPSPATAVRTPRHHDPRHAGPDLALAGAARRR